MSDFDVTTQDNITVIKPTTRLDQMQEKEFTKIIDKTVEDGAVNVVIDFCYLSTVSSSGLRLLMKAYKSLCACNGKMVVCSMNNNIDYLFDLVHLKRDLPVYKDANEAVANFKNA